MKVTIVGGGSYQWGPKLVTDLLTTPSLSGMHLALEDIDGAAAETMASYARLVADRVGAKATVESTTDQKGALDDADYVVVTISTGGFESMAVDLDVPARHGIRQSVGDTVGPGGINRSLRNIPVLLDIARDMEQCCPSAWLLNITNPMTCLTRAVSKHSGMKVVGLCHEVGNFVMDLAIALGMPHSQIRPVVSGINHFPVVCSLEIAGVEGFEVVAQLLESLGGLGAVRSSLGTPAEPFSKLDFAQRHLLALTFFDRFGAIPAAGDRHLAEFVPWVLTESSGWGREWGIELTPISRREEHQAEYIEEVKAVLEGRDEPSTWASGEMVAPVIDAMLTGVAAELPLNLPNDGQCPDLPKDAVVEAMCVVDADGIRGRDRAHAPPGLAEMLRRQVAVQELTVEAAVNGDRRLALSAFALDPLAGRGSLADIEAMTEELIRGTSRWLPQFAGDSSLHPGNPEVSTNQKLTEETVG
jgi:alpha-galactosidase/6-phospho-beta-glucosidase family protein